MFQRQPLELQDEIYNWWVGEESGRVAQILGGERSGKSYLTSEMLTVQSRPGTPEHNNLYWIVGPDYYQARAEWMYIFEAFSRLDLVEGTPSMPSSIAQPWTFHTKFNQTFMTRSSGEIQKLASFSVDGAAMVEAHQQPFEVYLKLLGRVSESRGPLVLSGTLEEGLPWYTQVFDRWQGPNVLNARSFSLPTWSNTVIYPGGREDPAIKELESEYPEDLFMERFGAVPRRDYNRVIPEFSHAVHVKKLKYEPDVPVELWVDPGKRVYAVLFVQVIGPYTHVLDRVYAIGRIAHDVIPEVMENPLFKAVRTEEAGVIDFAGTQEHANKSQVQLWREIAGCQFRSQYIHENVSIDTVRFRLRNANPWFKPLVYFNDHLSNNVSPNGMALDVLAEFETWRYPKQTPGKNERIKPYDANNHAVKALAYGLVDHFGPYVEKKPIPPAINRGYFIAPRNSSILGVI